MRIPSSLVRVFLAVGGLSAAACDAPAPPRSDDPSAPPEVQAPAGADAAGAGAAEAAATAGDRPVVVFLGTSLTAGLGLRNPQERWPERLGNLADSAGTPIQVVNAGLSGETSAGGLRRLDWILDRPMDVLVVELGANDGLRGQDPAALEANLRAIIRQAREEHPGVRIVLTGMEAPPNLGPEYTRRFRDVFPRVARDEGTALVPFLLEGVAGEPTLNQGDGIHPTARGHALMARTVWPVLDSLLRSGGTP